MHSISRLPLLFLLVLAVSRPALACWTPVEKNSSLTFHNDQPGGSDITGEFTEYDGFLCLEPGDAESGRLWLSVETASVATGLPELDEALTGPMFFNSAHWSRATFESESLEKLDGDHRYRVTGRFTLRDVSRTIEVPFTFVRDGDTAELTGSTTIHRLDYGVGQGQWQDTRWADNEVKLDFDIRLVESAEQPGE